MSYHQLEIVWHRDGNRKSALIDLDHHARFQPNDKVHFNSTADSGKVIFDISGTVETVDDFWNLRPPHPSVDYSQTHTPIRHVTTIFIKLAD